MPRLYHILGLDHRPEQRPLIWVQRPQLESFQKACRRSSESPVDGRSGEIHRSPVGAPSSFRPGSGVRPVSRLRKIRSQIDGRQAAPCGSGRSVGDQVVV